MIDSAHFEKRLLVPEKKLIRVFVGECERLRAFSRNNYWCQKKLIRVFAGEVEIARDLGLGEWSCEQSLHLLPGALLTAAYAVLVPVGGRFGVPAFAVFLVLGVVLLVPLELGYLVWQAWKRSGTLCISTVVSYRERIPSWQYVLLPLPLLVWMLLIFLLVNPPVETSVVERFFSWVPEDYHLQSFATHMADYNRTLLISSAVLLLIFGGIIGPGRGSLFSRLLVAEDVAVGGGREKLPEILNTAFIRGMVFSGGNIVKLTTILSEGGL